MGNLFILNLKKMNWKRCLAGKTPGYPFYQREQPYPGHTLSITIIKFQGNHIVGGIYSQSNIITWF